MKTIFTFLLLAIFSVGINAQYALPADFETPEEDTTWLQFANAGDAAENFKIAHPEAYEKDTYLWVDEKRKWTSAWSLAGQMIDEYHIGGLSRVKAKSVVSERVLSVLFRYVLPTEPDFPHKEARV